MPNKHVKCNLVSHLNQRFLFSPSSPVLPPQSAVKPSCWRQNHKCYLPPLSLSQQPLPSPAGFHCHCPHLSHLHNHNHCKSFLSTYRGHSGTCKESSLTSYNTHHTVISSHYTYYDRQTLGRNIQREAAFVVVAANVFGKGGSPGSVMCARVDSLSYLSASFLLCKFFTIT